MINNNNNEIYPYIKTHQIRYIEEKLFDVNLEDYSFLESEMEPQILQTQNNPIKTMLQKLEENIVQSEENEELNLDESSSDSDDSELIRKITQNDTSSEEMPKKVNKKFFNKKF